MKIKLIPTSHTELDTIEIDKDIFIIGRLEEPFVSYDSEVTSDLSRRHAKIFTENDHICIVDLESLNGTTLNDLTLGTKPLPVNNGDIIEFAKHLAYKIELVASERKVSQLLNLQGEINLILEPIDKTSGLDILVISAFPFLISKETGVFRSFPKNFESETSRISRRHAYILQEESKFKLIDLSSTNGTFVNNKEIDEVEPVTLKNGDIISFAGDFFTYIVKLDATNHTDKDTTVVRPKYHESEDENVTDGIEPKTTFVNEPSPFLDILCDDSKQQPAPEENSIGKSNDDQQKKISDFANLNQSPFAFANLKSKKTFLLLLTLACIAVVTAYQYFSNNTQEVIKLKHPKKYTDNAVLPMESTDPANSVAKELTATKVIDSIIPGWLAKLEQGQYSEAKKMLHNTKESNLTHPEIVSSMDMLQWVGNIHQYKVARNKNQGLVIFKDENNINSLFASWHNNQKQNRKTLEKIASNVPEFRPYYEQVQSDFRSLEYDRDIYLKAIKAFIANIEGLLTNDQPQELKNTVSQFETTYTAITGLGNIKQDINHYIKLNEAVNKKDIKGIAALKKSYEFKTPLFIEYSQQTFSERLPSKLVIEQYSEAIKSWQTGDDKTAIKLLLSISESKWGSSAQNKLERYKAILAEYSALKNTKGTSKYDQRLFKFHALLKLPEDNYFLNLIEGDFKEKKQDALNKAQKEYDQALLAWNKYSNNKDTGGLLRLKNHETDSYEAQAEKLSAAYQDIQNSLLIYEYLHQDTPTKMKQLSLTIKKEIEKQRKWLNDLELMLQPITQIINIDLLLSPKG